MGHILTLGVSIFRTVTKKKYIVYVPDHPEAAASEPLPRPSRTRACERVWGWDAFRERPSSARTLYSFGYVRRVGGPHPLSPHRHELCEVVGALIKPKGQRSGLEKAAVNRT